MEILGWCKSNCGFCSCWNLPFDIGIHSNLNVATLYIILMCISCFMFFLLLNYHLLFFIFILDYENDIKKNTFKWFSYLSSKWVVKQWRQLAPLAISNNTFGPGTAKEHIVQRWFNKFCKGNKSLEDEELAASHQKLRMTIESHHWSWSSYKFTSSCQRTQCLLYHNCLAFEANWKGEKAQKGGASWADRKSKKSSI